VKQGSSIVGWGSLKDSFLYDASRENSRDIDDLPERRFAPGTVTIFGAGVAGLTAAHELVERGFRVIVVEPIAEGEGHLQVGGMARSQHGVGRSDDFVSGAVLPWTTLPGQSSIGGPREAYSRRAQSVLFEPGGDSFADGPAALGAAVEMARELVKELSREADELQSRGLPGAPNVYLRIVILVTRDEARKGLGEARAARLLEALDGLVRDRIATEIRRLGTEENEARARSKNAATDVERDKEAETAKAIQNRQARLQAVVDARRSPDALLQWRVQEKVDTAGRRAVIELAWQNEVVLPGEHGYRFFPSFYRHLFDTMKRTPLYDEQGETHRAAIENLTATSSQVFAGALTSAGLTRRRPRSLEALRVELTKLFGELQFDVSDVAKFQGKLFRFMTTGAARREAEYESISWWQFLTTGGVRYSENFETFLKSAPQALVAMDAETCDAHTQGNIVVQLLLDQLLQAEYTDSTLNGPTSDAWLDLWREHLERQGVTFVPGRLRHFDAAEQRPELLGATLTVVPVVDLDLPGTDKDEDSERGSWRAKIEGSDYFVLATDVSTAEAVTKPLTDPALLQVLPGLPHRVGGVPVQLKEYVTYVLSTTDMRIKTGDSGDWDRLLRERLAVAGFPAEYWGHIRNRDELPSWINYAEEQDLRTGRKRPGFADRFVYGLTKHDRFQTFSGVQFYFAHDLEQARGHVYYFDTEWGLSSISPLQFWQRKTYFRRHGLLGLLSVDIGNFRRRSSFLGKAAHECTKEEIAQETWRQLSESLRRTRRAKAEDTQRLPLPRPVYYHVDNFLFPSQPTQAGSLCTTATPFLVNNVGDWTNRPGSDPWDPETEGIPADLMDEPNVWQADHGGYQVHYHKLVFAGTYMRTFTRMTTMEAANESARHAVNAILDHLAEVRSVAQKQAAEMYGQWVIERLQHAPPDRKSWVDAIEQLRKERLQMPLPLHSIAGEHCKIWNLERYELDDLAFLKRVDEALFKKGLPHMADIIDLDGLMASLSPAQSGPEGLLAALVSTFKKDWAVDDDSLLRGAKGAGALLEKLKEGLSRLTQEMGRGSAPP